MLLLGPGLVFAAWAVAAIAPAPIPGADPSGAFDSAPALNTALRRMCQTEALNGKQRPAQVVLDLRSGLYRLDSPVVIDHTINCTGPVRVIGGTLAAGEGFDPARFLVEATHRNYDRGIGLTLSFEHVVFASNYTGGGLLVNDTSFVTVADCNFRNFATFGIWTSGGDFRLDRSVLTECTDGMTPCEGSSLKATAMLITGADSHFNRNIVACTHRGFVNENGDNFYHQNHIWTNCHPPQQDNGLGDYNLEGFLVTGGTPQIDGGAIDNCHLVVSSYQGVVVTNMHFNAVSKLVFNPPAKPPSPPKPGDTRCQYWTGSMCSIRVANNRFDCGGSEPSNDGPKSSCGAIWVNYTPPAAQQIEVTGNVWGNESSAVCSRSTECFGPTACAELFGPCAAAPGLYRSVDLSPGVASRWLHTADELCRDRGFHLAELARLPAAERADAAAEAGFSPLQRLRVLAAATEVLRQAGTGTGDAELDSGA